VSFEHGDVRGVLERVIAQLRQLQHGHADVQQQHVGHLHRSRRSHDVGAALRHVQQRLLVEPDLPKRRVRVRERQPRV
jgi:hypothetical protein